MSYVELIWFLCTVITTVQVQYTNVYSRHGYGLDRELEKWRDTLRTSGPMLKVDDDNSSALNWSHWEHWCGVAQPTIWPWSGDGAAGLQTTLFLALPTSLGWRCDVMRGTSGRRGIAWCGRNQSFGWERSEAPAPHQNGDVGSKQSRHGNFWHPNDSFPMVLRNFNLCPCQRSTLPGERAGDRPSCYTHPHGLVPVAPTRPAPPTIGRTMAEPHVVAEFGAIWFPTFRHKGITKAVYFPFAPKWPPLRRCFEAIHVRVVVPPAHEALLSVEAMHVPPGPLHGPSAVQQQIPHAQPSALRRGWREQSQRSPK